MQIHSDEVQQRGFSQIEKVISTELIGNLRERFQHLNASEKPHGIRNILWKYHEVRELAYSDRMTNIVLAVLGPNAHPVRGIYFDKLPDANWSVVWHQDLAIAVQKKIDMPGYAAWTVKEGVQHVFPPASVLEKMLTLRLHLDDTDEDNGALSVIPGSHSVGRIASEKIAEHVAREKSYVCNARKGDVLAMKPLILHASSRSVRPSHRRIIHIEYAAVDALPEPLVWYDGTVIKLRKCSTIFQ